MYPRVTTFSCCFQNYALFNKTFRVTFESLQFLILLDAPYLQPILHKCFDRIFDADRFSSVLHSPALPMFMWFDLGLSISSLTELSFLFSDEVLGSYFGSFCYVLEALRLALPVDVSLVCLVSLEPTTAGIS